MVTNRLNVFVLHLFGGCHELWNSGQRPLESNAKSPILHYWVIWRKVMCVTYVRRI